MKDRHDRKLPGPDYAPTVIVPAGVRADRLKSGNIPVPSEESVLEEFRWVEEHEQ